MDRKLKHLEFIQGTINRLSTNSFLLKGWSVVLVSALFVLSGQSANLNFLILAALPAIVFWGLDGYFLWQERLYRKLYNHVRKLDDEKVDFSMDTSKTHPIDVNWMGATFSSTLLWFHGVLLAAIVVLSLSFE